MSINTSFLSTIKTVFIKQNYRSSRIQNTSKELQKLNILPVKEYF
jgi:hypothetical protein